MFTIAVVLYQSLTNEQQISLRLKNLWAFYGHNYGLSFLSTAGALCGLNIIPI